MVLDFVDPAYQGMILLKHGDKSEITNVIAVNFTNLKNIIPDFNSNNQILKSNHQQINKKIYSITSKNK